MVKSVHQEFNFQGAELSPEQQEQLKQQVEEALRTGKPMQNVRISPATGRGCSIFMLIAVLLAAAGWAAFGS